MSTAAPTQAAFDPSPAPSPFQRVLLTFTAPSRAFAHFGSGRGWWLPYLLVVLAGFGFVASVGSRVGWDTVARNNLANTPKQQARLAQASPAQQAQQVAFIAKVTRISAFTIPPLSPLMVGALVSLVLMATLNFLFGGSARFGPLFAVYLFSALPQVLKTLLATATLFAGTEPDAFQLGNPLGSNPAFYLHGSGLPAALLNLFSWFDIFLIWQLVILAIGASVVGHVTRGKAAGAVFGWVVVLALLSTVFAALA